MLWHQEMNHQSKLVFESYRPQMQVYSVSQGQVNSGGRGFVPDSRSPDQSIKEKPGLNEQVENVSTATSLKTVYIPVA